MHIKSLHIQAKCMVVFQIKQLTVEPSYVTTSHLFKTPNFPSQVTTFGTSSKQSPLIIESNHYFDNLVAMVLSDLSLEITVGTLLTFWMTVYYFFFFHLFYSPKSDHFEAIGVMISLFDVCTKLPSMQTTFSGSITINLKWHTMNSFVECSSYLP